MDPSDISEGAKGAAGTVASAIGDEAGKFAKIILGQITGKGTAEQPTASNSAGSQQQQQQQQGDLSAEDISNLRQKDDAQSEAEHKQVVNKINAIYAEYAAKRKQEEQEKKEQEVVAEKEEKRLEEIQKVEDRQNPNPAIAKTRAEVGKNFGAE